MLFTCAIKNVLKELTDASGCQLNKVLRSSASSWTQQNVCHVFVYFASRHPSRVRNLPGDCALLPLAEFERIQSTSLLPSQREEAAAQREASQKKREEEMVGVAATSRHVTSLTDLQGDLQNHSKMLSLTLSPHSFREPPRK